MAVKMILKIVTKWDIGESEERMNKFMLEHIKNCCNLLQFMLK